MRTRLKPDSYGDKRKAVRRRVFLVLMDHHGAGFQEAHPFYVEEKLSLLDRGYEAYGALDRENRERAKRHCIRWGFDLPEPVREYERQLKDSGIFE